MNGFHHGHYVFGSHIGQDIMHLLKNKSPARCKYGIHFPDMSCYFVRCGHGQDSLGIAAPTPEVDAVSKFLF